VGTFAYVVKKDNSVSVRLLKLGPVEGENVAVLDGLAAGEMVVMVGGDKLREGSKVQVITKAAAGATAPGSKRPGDGALRNGRKAADR
jgi:multidrug efflux system membrane fusion protein